MLRGLFSGYDLREYSKNVRRFYAWAVLLFSGMALFSLLYNLYLLRLGYQEDFIGQLAGLFPLASGLMAIPTGLLSDRLGRRPFLAASSLLLATSQLGLCLFTAPTALLLCSFIGGVAGTFIFVNFIPFLAENASLARRSQAIAIWMSIQGITRLVVSLVGGSLPGLMEHLTGVSTELPAPFRYALFLGAACTLSSIVPLLGMTREKRGHASTQAPRRAARSNGAAGPERASGGRTVPWKHLLAFGLISGFRGLSWGLAWPFLNVFFQEDFSASPAAIGVIFAAGMGIGLPSTMLAPALARRVGSLPAIVPLRLAGALCLGLVGWSPSLPVVILFFLLATAGDAMAVPTEMAFATNTLDRQYWARMQSLRVTGFQLLSGAASLWAGWLILEHGYGLVFVLAGAAQVVSAAVLVGVFGMRAGHGTAGPT